MDIPKPLQPLISGFLTGPVLRRINHITGAMRYGRSLWFFHRPDDPWSHLLLAALPDFLRRCPLKLEPRVLATLDETLNPNPEFRAHLGLLDAFSLARRYGLAFPQQAKIPSTEAGLRTARFLVEHQDHPRFLQIALKAGNALWATDETALEHLTAGERLGAGRPNETVDDQLKANIDLLEKMGHYSSGMLYYAGEWYWGLDRMDLLERRLSGTSAFDHLFDENNDSFDATGKSIEFYFSFRSPYSYLAAAQLLNRKKRHGFTIKFKPVLPMVKRGMKVPFRKRLAILSDAKREAMRTGIPFGTISDPLDGVERCLALVPFARDQNVEGAYVLDVMTAIWSRGVDVSEGKGLERLAVGAGLDFSPDMLTDERWMKETEANRRRLESLGLWGVPCFVCGDQIAWGQDRLWKLTEWLK